jgi:hypothetical protein
VKYCPFSIAIRFRGLSIGINSIILLRINEIEIRENRYNNLKQLTTAKRIRLNDNLGYILKIQDPPISLFRGLLYKIGYEFDGDKTKALARIREVKYFNKDAIRRNIVDREAIVSEGDDRYDLSSYSVYSNMRALN